MSLLPERTRERQSVSVNELQPIVQDLEKASRDALNSFKSFTAAMERVSKLTERYAAAAPPMNKAADVGLDASVGVSSDTVKLCRSFKRAVTRWSLSDAVVNMRAHLFAEWAKWRRAERRIFAVTAVDRERKDQQRLLRELQRKLDAMKHTTNATSTTAVKALRETMAEVEQSVRAKDAVITTGYSSLLKKSLVHRGLGAVKASAALHNVGRCLVKAFATLSVEELNDEGDEDEEGSLFLTTPVMARTPTMGVPLEIDSSATPQMHIASPASAEAEYGLGFSYQSLELVDSSTSLDEPQVAVAA